MEYTDGTVKYKVEKIGGGGVLRGVIMAFSGTFDSNGYPIDKNTGNADTTWHLCDGTNGTPDLRGRFILGASASHAVGTTGGKENHTLTESELPKVTVNSTGTTSAGGQHTHRVPAYVQKSGENKAGIMRRGDAGRNPEYFGTEGAGQHSHTVTASGKFGGGMAHNNMPPFYTLAFIMKL